VDDDLIVLRKTTKLMDFLAEVTAAVERNPIRDILDDAAGAPDPIIWLDELPHGVRLVQSPQDDVMLKVGPPRSAPEPLPPTTLSGWIDAEQPRGADGPEPELLELGPASDPFELRTEPPRSVVRAFAAWLAAWRSWVQEQERLRSQRVLYERLERAAKTLEQQDDEYEFVLGVGLLRWDAPDGEPLRRHLITEAVVPRLDRATAEVSVSLTTGRRRLEDREVLADQEAFQADRGPAVRQAIVDNDASVLAPELMLQLQDLLGHCLSEPLYNGDAGGPVAGPLPATPMLTSSPALIIRRRSRVLLAETYQRIAEALRAPGAQVPVALAQLVVETEAQQRKQWLREQGAVSGDVLGADPLFPLLTNGEQMLVIDLLRTETGVVVQGPPGTGKTHTIANLVSALLSRGQRVLVTSQKDQALKVLRSKIPPDLRKLCVLLAGGSKDAATELKDSLDALSGAIASPDSANLAPRIDALSTQRHELRSRSARLNQQVCKLREAEQATHDPVVPGFSVDRYRGTLGDIVREVKHDADEHGWIPPVAPDSPDVPPLSPAEALELLRLLRREDPVRRVRIQQTIPEPQEVPLPAVLAERFAAERKARATVEQNTAELTRPLAAAGVTALDRLQQLGHEFVMITERLGLWPERRSNLSSSWAERAVGDFLTGRHRGLWSHLIEVHGEAHRLQEKIKARGVGPQVEMKPISESGLGVARGMLTAGRELREHLDRGNKYRTLLPPSGPQKRAAQFIETIRVDGQQPTCLGWTPLSSTSRRTSQPPSSCRSGRMSRSLSPPVGSPPPSRSCRTPTAHWATSDSSAASTPKSWRCWLTPTCS
jgi:outer membrane murein-binding lipoprotein Lpp